MSEDQQRPTCERCDLPLVEVNAYGERLRGCIGCNRWQVIASREWRRLPEEDIVALRKSRTPAIDSASRRAGGAAEEGVNEVQDGMQVEVQGDAIIVTMRGGFRVTYRKAADYPVLIASHFMHRRPVNLSMRTVFLARAWRAAKDKARELGWIV